MEAATLATLLDSDFEFDSEEVENNDYDLLDTLC